MNSTRRLPLWRRAVPGLTLIVLTPLIIEVLPGATRLSVITSFPGVLPMQMGVWGCAALLIRAAVRRWRLGWLNMLFLGLALAIAEEFIIQQTSLAPMVLQIFPGEPFARAWGVNYVYLLWALGYESVFAVLVPVALTELMFRSRREQPWVGKWTAVLLCPVFLLASVFAWYIWTRFARPMGFHVHIYDPPLASMAIGAAAILALVIAALGPSRRALLIERKPLTPAPP